MKKISKFLSVILTLIMVISIIPMSNITSSAYTDSGTCGDNLTWTYDTSTYTLTIYGTGAMYDYGYNNRPWESYEDNIMNVVINNSVTTIGVCAFYDCNSLTSVTIPDSVTTIGGMAFYCNSLTSVTIPDSVTTIRGYAFYSCNSLTSITIPDSVTTIGYRAFDDCDSLTDVYYKGAKEEWYKISIDSGNGNLLNANIHFKNHTFGDWSTVTSPTCTENGLEKRICTECGKEETKTIFALGHKYNSVVTAPTCTERGYTTHTCTECGYKYIDNYVNAKGHTYTETVTNPTCVKDGYVTCTCECGDKYIASIIDTTGHEDNDVDAHCDYCDELLCDHDCHRGGITGFFWKISNFFNRLFRSNKYCECGVAHY